MQEFFIYILRCSEGSFGHTDNLEKRLSEHQSMHSRCYTKSRLPVELIFHASFGARDEAIAAERQIKGWSRAKKQALASNDFDRMHQYAKKPRNKNLRSSSFDAV